MTRLQVTKPVILYRNDHSCYIGRRGANSWGQSYHTITSTLLMLTSQHTYIQE